MPNYDPAEVKYWKDLIYSNMNNDTKVDEWAGSDDAVFKSPVRKSQQKKKWGSARAPGASPTAYSATDDFLTGSPNKGKRTYKVKGAIGKPTL
eukprot:CAMPEP_0113493358 /NCGR_PEP_ID=MMETSP0014_2-20120614/28551_1 /TAXON_ID=2857 /ORGANISM="Nitzschia sp." /LENGTH=92 /DNA_ID=CAMNT_0000387219 /DNA_START=128 /DNA_END=406 /DNA_ORIENTATION=+ /assembly_acc=CAM_ASM_000159